MNKHLLFFTAAIAAVTVFSCSEAEPEQPKGETVQMTVNVCMPENFQTKAVDSYTTVQAYESKVNTIQIFVFDDEGVLNAYHSTQNTSAILSVTAGPKQVSAIVNGPDLSEIKTQTDLQAYAVDLSANSTSGSGGFVMSGSSSCDVSGSSSSCSITVSRLASRVALVSVKNSLPASYGSLKIERVWLSNVVGNQNLKGDASASTWYNQEGRKDESTRVSTHIIDGSTYKASIEELTYKSVSQSVANAATHTPASPYLFYAFPNSSETAPDGFKDSFEAQRTVLVVAATVNSKLYYYPVVLDQGGLSRNTTYTVGLTITGLGSDDPNKPVTKGGLNISILIDGWESGANYDEVI